MSTDHWRTRKLLLNDGQCEPMDLGCQIKRIIESVWGIVESDRFKCDFSGLHTNKNGEKYTLGHCNEIGETILTKQCFELPYPFVKSTCRTQCASKGMTLDHPACNGDDVLCVCKPKL